MKLASVFVSLFLLATPAFAAPTAAPDPRDARIAALTQQVDQLTHLALRFRQQRDALAAKIADDEAAQAAQADVAAAQQARPAKK